jgi:tetratricopeptide (TPR) repeat protein
MFDKNSKFCLILAASFLLFNFAASNAQELGGTLGASSGIFRSPKSEKSAARETKKPARKIAPPVKAKTPTVSAAKPNRAPAKTVKIEKSKTASKNTVRALGKNSETRVKVPPVDIDELFEIAIDEGNAARDVRDFAESQKAYERALRHKPRDVRASYGLATIYTDQQRWDEAEKYYRQAIALEPTNVDAHIALSYVLVQPNRGGNVASRFVDAEDAARRAIALDVNNAFAYDQLGVALEARGIVSDITENAYRRAIELKPNYPVAHAHLARLLRKKGRNKDANAAYKKSVELANDVTNLMLVAEVLQSEQRFEESETLLRRIFTVDGTNPMAMFLLGRALLIKQNYVEAEDFLNKSIAVSPKTFSTYTALASLYLRILKYEKAENALLTALPLANENERKQLAGAFGLIGDGYLQEKKMIEAIRVYKKANELDAFNPQLQAKLTAAQSTNRQ